jgi:hypothetical protein
MYKNTPVLACSPHTGCTRAAVRPSHLDDGMVQIGKRLVVVEVSDTAVAIRKLGLCDGNVCT